MFSCVVQERSSNETIDNNNDYNKDSLVIDSQEIIQGKIEISVANLNKIIARNENKISNWELELANADSVNSIDIQLHIELLKSRVAIQKERLRRLKSKND
jgi:hypothetical protein